MVFWQSEKVAHVDGRRLTFVHFLSPNHRQNDQMQDYSTTEMPHLSSDFVQNPLPDSCLQDQTFIAKEQEPEEQENRDPPTPGNGTEMSLYLGKRGKGSSDE